MTMNGESTIGEDLAIDFPAARKPPQGSPPFWPTRDDQFEVEPPR
jgi:hypothetical protein